MDPSRGGPAARTILRVINPAAPAFTNRPCTQNCPAAATAVQSFLRSGALTPGTCNPLTEPAGYAIDPGPDTWGAARNWASTWTQIKTATPKHGTFVLVEADRGPNGPANLTQWHYFVVLNVRGTRFVVDGFLGSDRDRRRRLRRTAAGGDVQVHQPARDRDPGPRAPLTLRWR